MSRFWAGLRPACARLCLLVLVLVLAAGGCGNGDAADQPGAAQAQHGGAGRPGRPGGGNGRPDQPAVPVAVAEAFSGSIASYYKATATLEVEKEAEVLARVSGVVETLLAEEGDVVAEGDPLLTIDNAEYRYRMEQAEAATANLRARYERLEAMMAEQLATEEEFETAKSDLASAEADEGLARLTLSYTAVAAPFGGRVTQRLVDVGENLSVGSPVFVIADFDPLLARVHVPSREFNRLQRNQTVDLVLDSTGARLTGRITLISPIIDPASGTIKITVEVPRYPAGTRPGDFAQVQIVTERREGVTLVPRIAVLTDKGETVVYTVSGEGEALAAERRIVEVGFTDDDNAQILGGVAPGERVVVKGQRSLKHGMPVKILDDAPAGAEG